MNKNFITMAWFTTEFHVGNQYWESNIWRCIRVTIPRTWGETWCQRRAGFLSEAYCAAWNSGGGRTQFLGWRVCDCSITEPNSKYWPVSRKVCLIYWFPFLPFVFRRFHMNLKIAGTDITHKVQFISLSNSNAYIKLWQIHLYYASNWKSRPFGFFIVW